MLRRISGRSFLYDTNLTAKNGKPAITGSTHVFVSKKFPVVMLQDMPGVGRKGEVVFVPRGFARHKLLPEGLAVSGSLWQNIDAYANPELLNAAKVDTVGSSEGESVRPFDWVNDIHLRFVQETAKADATALSRPISKWDVLKRLSDQEELDLLAGDLSFPDGLDVTGLTRTGDYELVAKLTFRGWSSTYAFRVTALSKHEQEEKEKRRLKEDQAKMKNKKSFVLGKSVAD
jgi:ribosomal protein L9